MANELSRPYSDPTAKIYALVISTVDLKVRDVIATDWVAYVAADIDHYDIQMTYQLPGIFTADMPGGITLGTHVRIMYYLQDGVSPSATSDMLIYSFEADWTGSLSDEEIGGEGIVLTEGENCYGNLTDAASYFLTRYESDAWDEATTTERKKALISATRIIDRLNYEGEVTVEGQSLQFPRYDDLSVPVEIKIACYEIAFALLDGVDPETEARNIDLRSTKYGNVSASFDLSQNEYIHLGIPSFVAWTYLRSFIRDGKGFVIRRQS